MFEAIGAVRRIAFGDDDVRFAQALERSLESRLRLIRHVAQQRIVEHAPESRANFGDLPRLSQSVEPRRQRLLKRRRDRVEAGLSAALEKQPRDLLDEQRHAVASFDDDANVVFRQLARRGDRADHEAHVGRVERRERKRGVVRSRRPRRAEFGAHRGDDEQRRLRAPVRQRGEERERSRIAPLQVIEGEHGGLRPRARKHPRLAPGQLPAQKFVGVEFWNAIGRQGDVNQGRNEGRYRLRVESELGQRLLELCEAVGRWRRGVKATAAPFRDR